MSDNDTTGRGPATTEYDTLLAARRLLATVEAGRAASLSLAAAYLPLRSAAALRESFQDQGSESSLWPEAAVERRLAIERLRRAPPRSSREPEREAAPLPAERPQAVPPPQAQPTPPAPAERAVVAAPEPRPPAPAERAEVAAPQPPPIAEFDLGGDLVEDTPLAAPVEMNPVEKVRVGRPNRRLVPDDMLSGLARRPSIPPVAAPEQPAPSEAVTPAAPAAEAAAPALSEADALELAAIAGAAALERATLAAAQSADSVADVDRPTPPPVASPTTERPQGGLAARLGSLARSTEAPAPAGGEPSKPTTQVYDRRRDERVARRIALGHADRRAVAPVTTEPEPTAPAAAVVQAATPVTAVVAEASVEPEAAMEAEAVLDADTPADAEVAPEPAAPRTWESPSASLRSLAATLGSVTASLPPAAEGTASLPMAPVLSLDVPRQLSIPPIPVTAAEPELDGPYITLETPVVRESATRSTTATIEVRAAARIGSGGDETIALEGKDGAHDDIADDDSGEGMRVHFEVAAPARAAPELSDPGSGRLSFDQDDLTVVHPSEESRTDSKPAPAPVDHGARRLSDDTALQQFLDTARQHTERGEYQKAIQAFTDALDIRLTHSEAYIGRGRCHMELGDYTSAMSDFRRAEDLQPKHPDPQVAMGDLYFARKEYKRAIEFYDQAVELDGAHAMARCRRGISHYYRKNFRQAFQDLQRANALDPEIPNIKKYVQMALKKMERGE